MSNVLLFKQASTLRIVGIALALHAIVFMAVERISKLPRSARA